MPASEVWLSLDARSVGLEPALGIARLLRAEREEVGASRVEELRIESDCLRDRLLKGVQFIVADQCGPDVLLQALLEKRYRSRVGDAGSCRRLLNRRAYSWAEVFCLHETRTRAACRGRCETISNTSSRGS